MEDVGTSCCETNMGESAEYRVNLILTDYLVKEGKARAAKEGTSLSAVVRSFLAWWLEGRLPTPSPEPVQLSFTREQLGMPDALTAELAGRLIGMQKQIDALQRVIYALRDRIEADELIELCEEKLRGPRGPLLTSESEAVP